MLWRNRWVEPISWCQRPMKCARHHVNPTWHGYRQRFRCDAVSVRKKEPAWNRLLALGVYARPNLFHSCQCKWQQSDNSIYSQRRLSFPGNSSISSCLGEDNKCSVLIRLLGHQSCVDWLVFPIVRDVLHMRFLSDRLRRRRWSQGEQRKILTRYELTRSISFSFSVFQVRKSFIGTMNVHQFAVSGNAFYNSSGQLSFFWVASLNIHWKDRNWPRIGYRSSGKPVFESAIVTAQSTVYRRKWKVGYKGAVCSRPKSSQMWGNLFLHNMISTLV